MKKKVLKSIFTMTVTALMVSGAAGCQLPNFGNNQQTGVAVSSENVSDTTENGQNEVVEENANGGSQESVSQSQIEGISFEHSYETGYEQAVISGLKEDGSVAWSYVTDKYEPAQLDRVQEIGVYNNRYYFCEDSVVIALNPDTGEKVWENSEFEGGGVSFCFDEQGTLYISGYFSPDLMAIDRDGNTIFREENLDNSVHYWPYELSCEDGYVYVTYEACDDWNSRTPSEEWWEYSNWGRYTLNYCLADGSVGLEYNRMEPEPAYNGRYMNEQSGENADESLQIDYLGEGTYRMNLCINGNKHIDGIMGQLKDGHIEFRATYDNGAIYAGTVSQTADGLVLHMTESTDAAVPAGSEILFGNKSEMTVSG